MVQEASKGSSHCGAEGEAATKVGAGELVAGGDRVTARILSNVHYVEYPKNIQHSGQ